MSKTKRAIAIGFFDGVHIGHAALLEKTKKRASEAGLSPAVLSFDVHPDKLVFDSDIRLIGDAKSREEIIHRCFGIDEVIFIHFNTHVMNMPWEQFADNLLNELCAGWIVVGHDFTFGSKGEGTAEKLKEYCEERNVGCDIIPAVTLGGQIVSSTIIRRMISEGDMESAAKYLGHPHCLSDFVHSGYHIGQKLDAPTINMFFPADVIIPRHGVYATKVVLPDGNEYPSVTNIGIRPTFSDDGKVSVESHLLGYNGDLYGKPVRVDFYKFIREEVKFSDFDALTKQIRTDAETARLYFEQQL